VAVVLISARAPETVNDDLTGPGCLEQSTVPRGVFDAPGHLGGVVILACRALKDAVVGQLPWQDALLAVDDQACSTLRDATAGR
jgi:hypothetical protein